MTGIQCVSKEEFDHASEAGALRDLHSRPFLNLPKDVGDLLAGTTQVPGYIDPWDLRQNTKWDARVSLEDEKETTLAEIFVARKFHEFGVHRDKSGELQMIDPIDGKEKKFSGYRFEKALGGRMIRGRVQLPSGEFIQAGLGSQAFSENFLRNLQDANVIQKEDFKTVGGSRISEMYAINKHAMNPNKPYTGLTGVNGYTRYYTGRGKIVGTDTPIDEHMSIVQLDPNTFGVLEEVPNRRGRLLYTFQGLNKEEIEAEREKIANMLREKNIEPTENQISMHTLVGAAEMKKRIKEYKITDIFPQRKNENTADYAERISRLSDTNYVLNNFREFFKSANIGVHNLSWPDQLTIANAILEEKNSDRLVAFASQYKLDGLRTFLSLEHGGKEMSDAILALGEQPQMGEFAKKLFIKYAELADAAARLSEEEVYKQYKNPKPELIERIKENLLVKGKNLLLSTSTALAKKTLDQEKMLHDLDSLKADNELFRNLFALAKADDPTATLEDFAQLTAERVPASALASSPERLARMADIIRKNYSANPELQKAVLTSFQKSVRDRTDDTEVNVLERDGNIIAFDRVDYNPDGSLYFGSFNVDPNYCSAGIGSAFFSSTIRPLMEKSVINADCSMMQPISSYYVEAGFFADKQYVFAGEPSFSVVSIPGVHFASKGLSRAEIVSRGRGISADGIEIRSAKQQRNIKFSDLSESKVLTRYFFDRGTSEWFAVIEHRA